MKIEYLGHSCFKINLGGKNLLTDPFISGNPNIKNFDLKEVKCDFILISHGHGDHLLDVECLAENNPHATIISNFEIGCYFEKKGFKTLGLNIGGAAELDFGTVKYTHAAHSSSLPNGSYAGNPGGFVLWNETDCIYFAGDTGLVMDMKLIPLTCPELRVAILPIGGYFTMDVKDAELAANFIHCNKIIGCHYNTFDPIKIDEKKAIDYFSSKGKELILMAYNEQIII